MPRTLEVPDDLVERIERLRGGRPAILAWSVLALEQLEFGCAVSEELDASMEGTRDTAVEVVRGTVDDADCFCTIDGIQYRCGQISQQEDGTLKIMLVDTDEWIVLRFRPDGMFDIVSRQSCTEV